MLPNIAVTVKVFCDWSLYNVLLGFKENYSKSRGCRHTQFNHKGDIYINQMRNGFNLNTQDLSRPSLNNVGQLQRADIRSVLWVVHWAAGLLMVDGVTGVIAPSWDLLVSIRDHSKAATRGNSSSSELEIRPRPHMTLIGFMTGSSESLLLFINELWIITIVYIHSLSRLCRVSLLQSLFSFIKDECEVEMETTRKSRELRIKMAVSGEGELTLGRAPDIIWPGRDISHATSPGIKYEDGLLAGIFVMLTGWCFLIWWLHYSY